VAFEGDPVRSRLSLRSKPKRTGAASGVRAPASLRASRGYSSRWRQRLWSAQQRAPRRPSCGESHAVALLRGSKRVSQQGAGACIGRGTSAPAEGSQTPAYSAHCGSLEGGSGERPSSSEPGARSGALRDIRLASEAGAPFDQTPWNKGGNLAPCRVPLSGGL
jgi:hypothetical protein